MQHQDNFSEEELLLNDSFIRWALEPDKSEDRNFWENWASNANKKQTLQSAKNMALALRFSGEDDMETRTEAAWQQFSTLRKKKTNTKQVRLTPFRAVAATLTLLIISTLAWQILFPSNKVKTITSQYGTITKVTLPDNSTVVLNGNSQISYSESFENRAINLRGEAFFEVKKAAGKTFTVTTDRLSVEVLGTSFNVSSRPAKTVVCLSEGKIKANAQNAYGSLTTEMEVGDLIEINDNKRDIIRRKTNPKQYSAWTNRELVFAETPLSDVASLLKDNYGIEVGFSNVALSKKTLSGTIPSDDIETLLQSIESVFDIKIEKKSATKLIFKN